MPEGFMLYFRIDKANSLMDRFKFMGPEAGEPSPPLEAAILRSSPEPSLSRQEGFGPFWPFRTEVNSHQKKRNKIKKEIKSLLDGCFSSWVPAWSGCWRTRFGTSTSLERVLGFVIVESRLHGLKDKEEE